MALADVTPKCVDALTETGTNRMTRGAFIHIHTGPAIWSELQTWRRALAANLSFHYFTAVLAVRHAACPGISTAPIR